MDSKFSGRRKFTKSKQINKSYPVISKNIKDDPIGAFVGKVANYSYIQQSCLNGSIFQKYLKHVLLLNMNRFQHLKIELLNIYNYKIFLNPYFV